VYPEIRSFEINNHPYGCLSVCAPHWHPILSTVYPGTYCLDAVLSQLQLNLPNPINSILLSHPNRHLRYSFYSYHLHPLSRLVFDNSTIYAAVLNIVALLAATFTVVLETAEVIFGMSGKGNRFWKIRTCRRIYKWLG